MTTIDSYDISAADEPELLETLASLASRPYVPKVREWQTGPLCLPCPPPPRSIPTESGASIKVPPRE
jgi:hypothetical protein